MSEATKEPDVTVSPARKVQKGDSIPKAYAQGIEESEQPNQAEGQSFEEREPKLFVDVNVANFGL